MKGSENMSKYITKSFTFDGKRYYVRGKTDKEAFEKLIRKKAALEAGTVEINKNILVRDWISEWIENYKESDVNSRWHRDIIGICDRVIIPAIGHMPISKVKPLHVKKILNELSDKSSSYNSKVFDILRQIFRTAYANELIIKDPMHGLKKPQGVPLRKRRALTDRERALTLKVAEYHRGGLFILIMLFCGLRPQEVVPLQWCDIDFDKKIIKVYKALKSDGTVQPVPKTAAGKREVPIPDYLLNKLKKACMGPFELVCTNTLGDRYTASSFQAMWKSFKKELNIAAGCKLHPQKHQLITEVIPADLTLYCYRHTYCTDLQAAGVPINVAKELMGHEDISITSRIYTHKSDVAFNNAAELINEHVARGVAQRLESLDIAENNA